MEIKLTYDQAQEFREKVEQRLIEVQDLAKLRDEESVALMRANRLKPYKLFFMFTTQLTLPSDWEPDEDDVTWLLFKHDRLYPTLFGKKTREVCHYFLEALDNGFEQLTLSEEEATRLTIWEKIQ